MKTNISIANRFLLQNLFWIVPLNFTLIIFGIVNGIYQRSRTLENQAKIQSDITFQITNDSIQKKKLDSVLQNAKLLNKLTQKQ